MENHEIQGLETLCEMEIKFGFLVALYKTWDVNVYAFAIASKPFSNAIFVKIIVNSCVVAPQGMWVII
jgi:hypothetical protein